MSKCLSNRTQSIWNKQKSFIQGQVTEAPGWSEIPRILYLHILPPALQGDPEIFPGQPRDIVPPVFSSGPPLNGTFNVTCCTPSSSWLTPHLISKASQPAEQTQLHRLYLRACLQSSPRLMVISRNSIFLSAHCAKQNRPRQGRLSCSAPQEMQWCASYTTLFQSPPKQQNILTKTQTVLDLAWTSVLTLFI